MKLKSLDIENFRGIDKLHLEFGERLTVIVGENGVGKTSVLDALAILLDQYIARFVHVSPQRARQMSESDIQLRGEWFSLNASISIAVESEQGALVGWSLVKQDRSGKLRGSVSSDLNNLNDYVRSRHDEKKEELSGEPLLVYYGQRRAVLEMPKRLRDNADLEPIAGFRSALDGELDFREFVAWFRDRSFLELQKWQEDLKYQDHQLEAVRRAMTHSTGLERPDYRADAPRGLCVRKTVRRPILEGLANFPESNKYLTVYHDLLKVEQLSSGERIFLALAGDLARRLAILNPENDDPLRCKGIVLIDEVELHLHPGWQRKFLPWLLETFPGCQFVVTTHSPQVLGEVEAANIRVLRASKKGFIECWIPDATYGRDSNHILLHVLGADERDEGLKDDLDALDDAIANGRLQAAAEKLAELREKIEGSPPELTIAQARLERRQRQRGQEE